MMGFISLVGQLVLVASTLLTTGFSASAPELEYSNPSATDPTFVFHNYSPTLYFPIIQTRDGKPPAPTKVFSMQFEKGCVNIYDSLTTLRNKKIYFYTPIPLLEPLNVVPVANQANATQGILRISFTIWNQNVTDKVAQHLTQVLNEEIEPYQVQVYPFEKVRLTSKVQSADFSLTNEWQTFPTDKQKQMFTLNCPTKDDCAQVKNRIRKDEMKHLRLEFYPQNDDACFNGVGTSQEDFSKELKEKLEELKSNSMQELTRAKQELLANFEAKLANELKTFREVALQDLEKTMRSELTNTKADLTMKLNLAQKELDLTRTELNKMKSVVDDLMTKSNGYSTERSPSEIVDIGKMPTSCADLERIGHKLSGFFSVKGSKNMEMVYCNFYTNNQNDKEKRIGYTDVKTAPVHFHVQRNDHFTKYETIPFNVELLNEGKAMNLKSGIFTAPRSGIYFFSFTGLAEFPASASSPVRIGVSLISNGALIERAFVEEANTVAGQRSPLTLQSTIKLKKGDQVRLEIYFITTGVKLYDNHNRYTHFTGFILEEDIFA